jgi:hypothetical protein
MMKTVKKCIHSQIFWWQLLLIHSHTSIGILGDSCLYPAFPLPCFLLWNECKGKVLQLKRETKNGESLWPSQLGWR